MSLQGDIIQIVKDHIIAEGNPNNIDIDSITVDSNLEDSGADHWTLEQIIAEKYDIGIFYIEVAYAHNREPEWAKGSVATIIETVQELTQD
jgi:hypothetical protein